MSQVAGDALPELRDVHAKRQLGGYLAELCERRAYIWHVSVNELRHRQVTNVLGNLWHLLNPALSIAVYYLVFGLLLKTDRGVDNFFLFLTIGIFVFQFTQKGTTDGAKSIVNNKGLIKAVQFPRALLPMTSIFTELLAMAPNLVVIYAVALFTGEPPSLRWILIVPVTAVQFVFTLGTAFLAARMTVHFIDTIQILPFVFRLLLYGSGVIFSVDAYLERDDWVHYLFTLNPIYCFITLSRWTIMGDPVKGELAVSALVWTVLCLIVGFVWFRAGEELYSRD